MTDRSNLTGLNLSPDVAELDRLSFEMDCAVDVLFGVHELIEHGWDKPESYQNALWAAIISIQRLCEGLRGELYIENGKEPQQAEPYKQPQPAAEPKNRAELMQEITRRLESADYRKLRLVWVYASHLIG